MLNSTPPGQLADLFASMVDLSLAEKLEILETVDLKQRLAKVVALLNRQIQVLKISQKLQSTVENKLGKKQREFLLREQLEAIKKELGETDEEGGDEEVGDLSRRIAEAKLPEEAQRVAHRELKRLKRMNPSMAEHQVIRTYLECITELPWSQSTPDNLDVIRARGILDNDHYGLDRVKTRIVEYLAVRKLKNDLRGPIMCFVGPPGVGKTSLGKSIANALGRKFYRISLGGVRDEAEIRGHRRTYIGALPGLIIQGLRRCGVNNPVFLLDEIDKLGHDFRGDPAAALLEVLDPEQNSTFADHYLNLPFDLSKVLFIATANELDTIPAPLLDRMELINIPGYTFEEKLHIARRYLLPKQISEHGLRAEDVAVPDDVIMKIATGYTREAGVRNLEREIASVCRSLAVEYSHAKERGREALFDGKLSVDKLASILGADRYDDEVSERTSVPGVVTGLAWTATGSGGLLFIEASQTPGKGTLSLTGKLGDVIKESAQIGITWVRANATRLGLETGIHKNIFEDMDVHIHFPAGAIPKDGPSAGVTIVTALVSLLTATPVRDHTAMTGEITLRGQVLPVGGIKEKVLAAHRGGVNRVILPFRNQKDLSEIPDNVKTDMEFVFAKTVWDVLRAAFPLNTRYLQIGNSPLATAARL
ncbi:Lon protease C-terminal proteolytic domain-containing protein [Entophlyctis helioformis]|nr:Lon protease C-terminal proteolytic domain-containing protein [Entophlyctis helioformis]